EEVPMGRFACPAVFIVLFAGPVSADDTYTIKLKEPKRGDAVAYTAQDDIDVYIEVANDQGRSQFEKKIKATGKFVYWEQFHEVKAGVPTRSLCGFGEARFTLDGESTVLPVEGK